MAIINKSCCNIIAYPPLNLVLWLNMQFDINQRALVSLQFKSERERTRRILLMRVCNVTIVSSNPPPNTNSSLLFVSDTKMNFIWTFKTLFIWLVISFLCFPIEKQNSFERFFHRSNKCLEYIFEGLNFGGFLRSKRNVWKKLKFEVLKSS